MTSRKRSNDSGRESETDERVLSYRAANAADAVVRLYQADGTLYAYRDGEEHVVVSLGRESSTRWVKRHPAERETVESGEMLWTIPDNWDQLMAVQPYHDLAFCIFRIPETGVDVTISIPFKSSVADADYNVEAVGELTAQFVDSCDWGRLNEIINDGRSRARLNPAVIRELEVIAANADRIEAAIEERVTERVLAMIRNSRSVQKSERWIIAPWHVGWHISHDEVLIDVLADHDVPESVCIEVSRLLIEENVVPLQPNIHIGVQEA